MSWHYLSDFTADELLVVPGDAAIVTYGALNRLAHYASSHPTSPTPGRVWRSTWWKARPEDGEKLTYVENDPTREHGTLWHSLPLLVVS